MQKTYYHVGDKFSIISVNDEPMEYILAKTAESQVALINLKTGNYWERSKKVKDCGLITCSEFKRITGEHLGEIPFKIERTFINNISEVPVKTLIGKRVELSFLEGIPAGRLERVNSNGTLVVSQVAPIGTSLERPVFYLITPDHMIQEKDIILVKSYQRSSSLFKNLAL